MHNLLLVEDSESDAELAGRVLRDAGLEFRLGRTETAAGFRRGLAETPPAVIIADYLLPLFTCEEALGLRDELCAYTPFIVLTGALDRNKARKLLSLGADYYLLKDEIQCLPAAVVSALSLKRPHKTGGPRVLLIEDDEPVRRVTQRGLGGCGFRVDQAGTLGQGLALFRATGGAHEIIFADIFLPDGLAHEAASQFQKINPSVKMVFTTGRIDDSGLPRSIENSGHLLIPKPYDIRTIEKTFLRLLRAGK